MDFNTKEKLICTLVFVLNIFISICISSWCYVQILRHRGELEQNSPDANVNEHPPQANAGNLSFIRDLYQELSGIETIEMRTFRNLERQKEIRKQQAEIKSAVLLLKTNLSIILVLILLPISVIFLSSDVLAVIFTLTKSYGPVVTYIINFGKIRALFQNP
jgi:hypothetical protein